ncbi:MAG: MATE family efflux transporter [Planctomycetota bacterium]|nr:MATE family efflux transporter [Planctomycetota bacterium]
MTLFRRLDRRILALALPAAGSALVPVIHRMVDMAWIRELGTEAVAALGVATISVWLFVAIGWAFAMGLTALVGRYVGARRPDASGYVASQGLRWGTAIGVLCIGIGWFLAPVVFRLAGTEAAVHALGVSYTRIYWAGGAFVLVQFAGDAICRGHGDTRTPLKIGLASLALNAVIDPLFIRGIDPILPAMGVAGAALATVIASVFAAVLYLYVLRQRGYLHAQRPPDESLRFEGTTRLGQPGLFGLDGAIFRRVARVGTPTFITSMLFDLILLEMMRVAEHAGGPAAQAGLTIGHTGEGFAFVMGLGWSAAAASLVGRRMGAGQIHAAERAAWRAAIQCGALNLLFAVLMFGFADELAWLWAKEPAAHAHAASYYRIVAWCLVPQAIEIVIDGAFGGAGMTVPPMVVGVSLSAARIPLAWWAVFDLGLGVDGIWIVVAATASLRGLLIGYWFSRGTWKTRSV